MGGVLANRLRSDVIRWGHCSKVACHPGINRTPSLVKQRFWWPVMTREILDFVWPARSVLVVRLPIVLQRVSFNRCKSLRDLGPT